MSRKGELLKCHTITTLITAAVAPVAATTAGSTTAEPSIHATGESESDGRRKMMNSDKIKSLSLQKGDTIRISGRSLKLKNRIREHGDVWRIRRIGGPFDPSGILVESLTGTGLRWITDGSDVMIHKCVS